MCYVGPFSLQTLFGFGRGVGDTDSWPAAGLGLVGWSTRLSF